MSSKDIKPVKKENQLVIGICGPSTSGKSTIIYELLEKYDFKGQESEVIALENYFYTHNAPKTEVFGRKFTNLDLKESINWNSFYKRILKENSPILFLDGFILFADERSFDLVDACIAIEYNIETDFEIALDRRINRYSWNKKKVIDPDYLQNPFKNPVNSHCTYFHKIVWPEMVKHPEYRKPQNWKKPILTLSATNNLEENVSKAIDFLKPIIDSHINK